MTLHTLRDNRGSVATSRWPFFIAHTSEEQVPRFLSTSRRQLHSAKLSLATLRHTKSELLGLPDVLGSTRAYHGRLATW
jgi:hypothetical protein